MKLQKLKIHNFVGVEDAEVAFKRPVSLFAGRNNQGKSSIKDAVLFALTGKCRALTKFKDVQQLAHGDNGMAVDLDYATNDGTDLQVHRTPSSVSLGIDERAVLRYCLNPAEFIELPTKERAKILSEVLGGGMDELIKSAIQEHIGGVDQTVLAELKGSRVNLLDVDAFRNEVVEQRRQYKRDRDALPDKPPLKGDYELTEDYDVSKDREEVKTLAERIAKGGQLIADARKANEDKVEILSLENEIKKLKEQTRKVPPLPRGVDKDKLNMAPVYMAIQETMISMDDCVCEVCKRKCSRSEISKLHDELAEWLSKYQGKLDGRAAAIENNERIERDIKAKTDRLDAVKAGIKQVDIKAGSEKLLDDLTKERDAAQVRINSFERFERDLAVFEESGKRRDSLTELIAECDRIDAALKDGGPVKSAIAAGGRELPINDELLKAWDMPSLRWSDTGQISLAVNDSKTVVLIENASKSERQRAACVMGLALAGVSGVGIAAIDDEFESLDEHNRDALFSAVIGCGLNNVLVFASTNKDYSQYEMPDWLEVYQVQGGKVSRVS